VKCEAVKYEERKRAGSATQIYLPGLDDSDSRFTRQVNLMADSDHRHEECLGSLEKLCYLSLITVICNCRSERGKDSIRTGG
jgi:hypothetical protein